MAESTAYFVRGDDGEEYGPVDLAEMREWVAENRVGLGTSVRPDAPEGQWSAWQHYPELVALLAEVQAVGNPAALPILAPWGRRVTAFVVDVILSLVLFFGIFFIIYCLLPPNLLVVLQGYTQAMLQGLNPPVPELRVPFWFQVSVNIALFGVPLLYYCGFYAAHGRTPAKSLLQLQVVDATGQKPRFSKALLRAFVFVVCVYFFYGIPLVYAFFNPQRRALHDIAAGTYVVEL
jgi:uncharacterized RDD family membrane protein YckC